jgi:hypothetical protein
MAMALAATVPATRGPRRFDPAITTTAITSDNTGSGQVIIDTMEP